MVELITIDEIDTNALFHLLPPDHREKFLQALKNPESEATRQLLELAAEQEGEDVEEAPIPDEMPWWEAPDALDEEEEGRYADLPDLVRERVLIGIDPPEGVGMKLVYNAMAIWYVSSILYALRWAMLMTQSRICTCPSVISPTLARPVLPLIPASTAG